MSFCNYVQRGISFSKTEKELFQTAPFLHFFHLIIFICIYHIQHQIRNLWVKLCSPAFFDFAAHDFLRSCFAVASIARHRVISVRYTDNTRNFRDIFSDQSIGIALTVIAFMMKPCTFGKTVVHGNIAQNMVS